MSVQRDPPTAAAGAPLVAGVITRVEHARNLGVASSCGDLIAFLCSSRGTYITGVAINMDGGLSAVV